MTQPLLLCLVLLDVNRFTGHVQSGTILVRVYDVYSLRSIEIGPLKETNAPLRRVYMCRRFPYVSNYLQVRAEVIINIFQGYCFISRPSG